MHSLSDAASAIEVRALDGLPTVCMQHTDLPATSPCTFSPCIDPRKKVALSSWRLPLAPLAGPSSQTLGRPAFLRRTCMFHRAKVQPRQVTDDARVHPNASKAPGTWYTITSKYPSWKYSSDGRNTESSRIGSSMYLHPLNRLQSTP